MKMGVVRPLMSAFPWHCPQLCSVSHTLRCVQQSTQYGFDKTKIRPKGRLYGDSPKTPDESVFDKILDLPTPTRFDYNPLVHIRERLTVFAKTRSHATMMVCAGVSLSAGMLRVLELASRGPVGRERVSLS